MQSTGLLRGIPQTLTRAGAMLHVVNHPELDYNLSGFVAGATSAGYVLLGFDRTPTAQGWDGIVPPFTEVLVSVPDGVKVVNILWPLDSTARTFRVQQTTLPIAYEWAECPAAPYIRDLSLYPVRSVGFYAGWNDSAGAPGNAWMPSRWTPVLDQGSSLGQAPYDPHLRPFLAPARVVVNTGVLVANTLTPLGGVAAPAAFATGRVLKSLTISASGAGLVVVGDAGLTVASPSNFEAARARFPGAGIQAFDYREGLELGAFGTVGTWQYYASTAITVDVVAVLG